MKQKEKDEQFAASLPSVLQYHATILGDAVRNRLLSEAVKRVVNSETSFLDVGAGTGVWAIYAATLGAKRVVAVEVEEALIPVIFKHAQENGVADRIEIVHGRSDDVKLRGNFDVIVSELFGGDALGSETINSFIDVRERFLTPGGTLIPQKLEMFAIPASLKAPQNGSAAALPLQGGFFSSLRLNYPQNVTVFERDRLKFLGSPVKIAEADFRTISEPPPLSNLTATWRLKDVSKADAIAVFNRSTFADGIQMDTSESQSWGIGIYPFGPLSVKEGDLRVLLTIHPQNSNWTVSIPSEPSLAPQSYSPVFAFTRLRMAQQMTPHRRFRSKKK